MLEGLPQRFEISISGIQFRDLALIELLLAGKPAEIAPCKMPRR